MFKIHLDKALLCLMLLQCTLISAQEAWTTTFENREELVHITDMKEGGYLLSGKSHELGAKSDLVVWIDSEGKEVSRRVLCQTCPADVVLYSKLTPAAELVHVRSNGDIYVSASDLSSTEFAFNIKQDEFENIQTYQVLENNHFIIIVSYAVKDNLRGLLHTVMDTRDRRIYSQKFNLTFPDISGSIGIDLFEDQSVVEGYNTQENGVNIGHLIRLGRDRSEVIWEADFDFGNARLEHVAVSFSQLIYAVGWIEDESRSNHDQGLLVIYDADGKEISRKTFDSINKNAEGYEQTSLNFTNIEQVSTDRFYITGYDAGRLDGATVSTAVLMQIDADGNLQKRENETAIAPNSFSRDVIHRSPKERVMVGNAFTENIIAGSFVTNVVDETTSTFELEDDQILIFPNPTSDMIYVNTSDSGPVAIRLMDLNGQLIDSVVDNQLSMRDVESGVYLIEIVQDKKVKTQKVIKL